MTGFSLQLLTSIVMQFTRNLSLYMRISLFCKATSTALNDRGLWWSSSIQVREAGSWRVHCRRLFRVKLVRLSSIHPTTISLLSLWIPHGWEVRGILYLGVFSPPL